MLMSLLIPLLLVLPLLMLLAPLLLSVLFLLLRDKEMQEDPRIFLRILLKALPFRCDAAPGHSLADAKLS